MVKYCAVCGETFSPDYSYCPKCTSVLTDFEAETKEFYQLTFVEPKDLQTRNLLFLASFALMLTVTVGGTIYSLFNADAYIGALDDDLTRIVSVIDSSPLTEIETPEIKGKGKTGGGGAGSGKDNAPISKGELPPQFKEPPLLTPSKEDISANSELKMTRATRGPNDIIPNKKSATNGDPTSSNPSPADGLSSDDLGGMGQNGSGGIGENGRDGVGRNGTGGIGTSPNNKYGHDPRDGGNQTDPRNPENPPELKRPAGPTIALNIIAKPRAVYTDAARQAAVQGTVTLRVTFMANGEIGSIAVVSGLPHGLTEQAIAAARNMRFEPAQRNGQPYTVTKNVQYNFILY